MLLLLPNVLSQELDHSPFISKSVDEAIFSLKGIIAENEKNARVYLKKFSFSEGRTFRDIPIKLLNEHTNDNELSELACLIKEGGVWGLISDCGLPCIADPGASLVAICAKQGVKIKTFAGPSSIVMALQLSGIYCQQFSFLGYLPKEEKELIAKLKFIEKEALEKKVTFVFIEAPYRNDKLLKQLLANLSPKLRLCTACNLTLSTEFVKTQTVDEWRKGSIGSFDDMPTVFVVGK